MTDINTRGESAKGDKYTPPPNGTVERRRVIDGKDINTRGVEDEITSTGLTEADVQEGIKASFRKIKERNFEVREFIEARSKTLAGNPDAEVKLKELESLFEEPSHTAVDLKEKVMDIIENLKADDTATKNFGDKAPAFNKGDSAYPYSVMTGLKSLANKKELDGINKEVHDFCKGRGSNTSGDSNSFLVPTHLWNAKAGTAATAIGWMKSVDTTYGRGITSTGANDGAQISLDNPLASQFIDAFRHTSILNYLAVNRLDGLPGKMTIPVGAGDAVASWRLEAEAAAETQTKYGQRALTPHMLSAFIKWTHEAIINASIDLEMNLMNSLNYAIWSELERAFFLGDGKAGSGEPLGILNNTNVDILPASDAGTNGVEMTYKNLTSLTKILAQNNVLPDGSPGKMDAMAMMLVANFSSRDYWLNQLKFPNETDSGGPIIRENNNSFQAMVAGMPCLFTNYLPSTEQKGTSAAMLSSAIYGNWKDTWLASWDTREVIYNPYSDDKSAMKRITIHCWHDFNVRRNEALIRIPNIITETS